MTPEAHTTYTNQTGEEEEEVGSKKKPSVNGLFG